MYAFVGILLLGASYVLGSLAIDTGRWLFYFLTFATLIMGLKFGLLFFKGHEKK